MKFFLALALLSASNLAYTKTISTEGHFEMHVTNQGHIGSCQTMATSTYLNARCKEIINQDLIDKGLEPYEENQYPVKISEANVYYLHLVQQVKEFGTIYPQTKVNNYLNKVFRKRDGTKSNNKFMIAKLFKNRPGFDPKRIAPGGQIEDTFKLITENPPFDSISIPYDQNFINLANSLINKENPNIKDLPEFSRNFRALVKPNTDYQQYMNNLQKCLSKGLKLEQISFNPNGEILSSNNQPHNIRFPNSGNKFHQILKGLLERKIPVICITENQERTAGHAAVITEQTTNINNQTTYTVRDSNYSTIQKEVPFRSCSRIYVVRDPKTLNQNFDNFITSTMQKDNQNNTSNTIMNKPTMQRKQKTKRIHAPRPPYINIINR